MCFRVLLAILVMFLYNTTNSFGLSLSLLLDKAKENDWKVKYYLYQIKAKKAAVEKTKSKKGFQFNIGAYYGWDKYETYYGTTQRQTLKYYLISLDKPLYIPGFHALIESYKKDVDIAKLEKSKEENNAKYVVLSNYLKLAYDQTKFSLLKELKQAYYEYYLFIQKAKENHKATEIDLLDVKRNLLDNEANLKQLQEEIKYIKRIESVLTGIPAKEIDSNLNTEVYELPPVPKLRLENNLDVKIADLYVKKTKADLNYRKKQRYPNLKASISYTYTSTSSMSVASKDFRAALSLNFPLYQGGYVKADVLEAGNLLKAAIADYKSKKQELKQNWIKELSSFEANKAKFQGLTDLLAIEYKKLETVQKGVKEHLFTRNYLFQEKIRILNTEIQRLDSLYNCLNSYVNMLYLINQLDKYSLKPLEIFFKAESPSLK